MWRSMIDWPTVAVSRGFRVGDALTCSTRLRVLLPPTPPAWAYRSHLSHLHTRMALIYPTCIGAFLSHLLHLLTRISGKFHTKSVCQRFLEEFSVPAIRAL